ncbi:short-subunit dehydrogenase [Roseibium hamelinense]|uniref:Short-subunit dehydrogenase n=1 Tax=Roseibium hamelinense TaxID=150831 RepID=A0A562THY5_9HYPH|nr:SDR family NAD(P)-dependent oxidoreductase [Roseibium hamelinense]MTI45627.1 SDR family NAD(P)-dependent oxidoreductase [Roseibium hamelinense]TWI93192.1 short-subunit dehydrogenase [Roseibium hamelinense]
MKTALITGGAGGLGQALAAELRKHGWFTALIDLPGPALEALSSLPNTLPLACDVTDPNALANACRVLRAERPSLDLAVYNAGLTHIGPAGSLQPEAHRHLFEVNYFSAVHLAQHLILDLRQTRGVHLAISSVAGFAPLTHRAAYAASKHALEGFFKSLRSEEAPYGVACLVAAPSFIATNSGNSQKTANGLARPGSAKDGLDEMPAAVAARTIFQGLSAKTPFIPVGRVARFAHIANRLSPALYQRLMERRFQVSMTEKGYETSS